MNILICGLGSIGKRHLRILQNLGEFKITAFRSGKSQVNPDEFNIQNEITSLDNLSEYKFDAALITNPTSDHIPTALKISKFDIPMFIEKPLGKNLEGSDELQKIVGEKNIPVLMGYNFIFHPGIVTIKNIIKEGKIGTAASARSQFGTYMPGWHPEEDYKKSYAAKKEMGGGVILTSIHEQNYLTSFFGEVTDVKAMEVGGDLLDIDSDEGVEILMKHKSGVVSNIHLNFFQKPYYRNCQIIGTEGTIYWDFMKPEVKILKNKEVEITELGDSYLKLLDISYEDQMKHFIEVAKRNVESAIPLERGIEDMRTALKILKEIGRNYN